MTALLKNRPTRRQQSTAQLVAEQFSLLLSLTPPERHDELKERILGDTELVDAKTLERINRYIELQRKENARKVNSL